MARKTPQPDVKMLYGKAAGRCAFPSCRRDIVLSKTADDSAKQVGKIAHIVAHSEDGPRGDPDFPIEDRDKYDNWILLCSNCHDQIDIQPNTYTVEYLRKLKKDHEDWVANQLDDAMPELTFSELEVAADAIANLDPLPVLGFQITAPAEKIEKNGLSASAHRHIVMGLSQSREVSEFITNMAAVNPRFPDKLVAGFRSRYDELVADDFNGDALFEAMLDFAGGGSSDFTRKAAGLAILAHLFEKCDVFEK